MEITGATKVLFCNQTYQLACLLVQAGFNLSQKSRTQVYFQGFPGLE